MCVFVCVKESHTKINSCHHSSHRQKRAPITPIGPPIGPKSYLPSGLAGKLDNPSVYRVIVCQCPDINGN